jgi:hypothetical protein
MAFEFSKIAPFVGVGVLIIVIAVIIVIKNAFGKGSKDLALTKRDSILRSVGITLNIIWMILLIPVAAVCFMAGVATVMMTDSGQVSAMQTGFIMLSALAFWATPVAAIVSIILSFAFRKKDKYLASVVISIIPLAVALFAFAILFLIPLMH